MRTFDGDAKDYAAELVEECYSEALENLPGFVRYHIDWEGVARDMEIGGDIDATEQDGEFFVVTNASEF